MRKLLAIVAVGFMTLGLAACSGGDAAENEKADIAKPVSTIDEAWEQLDELNYSFSKVGDAEWLEVASPILVQCSADEKQVQIYTAKKGLFSESLNHEEIAKKIAKILKDSGLDVSSEAETLASGESDMGLTTIYASSDENINLTINVDATGYIDLNAHSKCVEGDIETSWNAPGRAPIIKSEVKDQDETEEVVSPESEETVPAEEEIVAEETE